MNNNLNKEHMEKLLNDYIDNNNLIEIDNIDGKINYLGKTANKEKNRIKIVIDDELNEYCIMYCEKNTITKFSLNVLNKITDIDSSWYLLKNNYIGTHMNNTIIYLHQYLMNLYGQGKGSTSIDHINRDKLDNRFENLRYANSSIQNSNMNKKNRQKTAQGLPDGITQSMLPKYVYYCTELMNKGKLNEYTREFFRIEKHPNLNGKKCISSTKSIKVSIIDKLNEINNLLSELDNNNLKKIIDNKNKYPKYISVIPSKRTPNKLVITYERKINGKKETMTKTINNSDDPFNYLNDFCEKIHDKYNFNPLNQ